MKLRKSRPAAINKTTVSAISPDNRILRNDALAALPRTEREVSCNAVSSPFPVEEIAGISPDSKPANSTMETENIRTDASVCTAFARGRSFQCAAIQAVAENE